MTTDAVKRPHESLDAAVESGNLHRVVVALKRADPSLSIPSALDKAKKLLAEKADAGTN